MPTYTLWAKREAFENYSRQYAQFPLCLKELTRHTSSSVWPQKPATVLINNNLFHVFRTNLLRPISVHIQVLFFRPCLRIPSYFFHSSFPFKILHAFLYCHACCMSHPLHLLYLIALLIVDVEYKP
jgi:hypothetical protein